MPAVSAVASGSRTVYTTWADQPHASFTDVGEGEMQGEFKAKALSLSPVMHRALVEDQVDEDDAALVELLSCTRLVRTRQILRCKRALSPASCAALREAVDAKRDVTKDSVDNMAQHQLNIQIDHLTSLVGRPAVLDLWRIADEVLAVQRREAFDHAEASGESVAPETLLATEAATGGFHVDMFVRRYSHETRPWIGFHHDVSTVTVNVALCDERSHRGGRLHAIVNAKHTTITRDEGEATGHTDDVMHAVSAVRSGTRYSLVLFFYALQQNDESLAYQTVPVAELRRAATGAAHDAEAGAQETADAAAAGQGSAAPHAQDTATPVAAQQSAAAAAAAQHTAAAAAAAQQTAAAAAAAQQTAAAAAAKLTAGAAAQDISAAPSALPASQAVPRPTKTAPALTDHAADGLLWRWDAASSGRSEWAFCNVRQLDPASRRPLYEGLRGWRGHVSSGHMAPDPTEQRDGVGFVEISLMRGGDGHSEEAEEPLRDSILTLPGLVSASECLRLIEAADRWCDSDQWTGVGLRRIECHPDGVNLDGESHALAHLILSRALWNLEVRHPELAAFLFSKDTSLGDLWFRFSGQEPMLNRYTEGGSFDPHQDGHSLTVLVPLSTADADFTGGGTAFWSEEATGGDSMTARSVPPALVMRPTAGTGLFWRGHVTHAGLPVIRGVRHVFVASFNLRPPRCKA